MSRRKQELQAGYLGERAEVSVSGDKWNPSVQTQLSDQGIPETRAAAFGQNLRAQCSGALPKAGLDFDERKIQEASRDGRRQFWIAEEFRENHREYQKLVALQRFFQHQNVVTGGAHKERNPCARIRGDHRSSLSCCQERENRTLP
jgi:hypothetical protein